MRVSIRQAAPSDTKVVIEVLCEAARWLEQKGLALWRDEELLPMHVSADVDAGLFFMAESDGEVAGVVRFQLADEQFWPDVQQTESAFLHRLAVRRRFAGGEISSALLRWAIERTRSLDRKYLRLDCEASRPKLRRIYERFGFVHHSDRQVGPYLVSRYEYKIQDAPPEKL